MRITEPGFIKVPQVEYHLDPCPRPSLSSGLARIMLNQSPAHAWTAHPRLNDHWEAERSTRMDIGSCCHEILLDDGVGRVILDFPDYKTKAAREARDQVYADGKTPILTAAADQCMEIVSVARDYIQRCGIDWPHMLSEQTYFWEESPGIWCRAMTDKMSTDRRYIVDYKTTSGSAYIGAVTRRIFDAGYHVQQAFYERGLDVLDPHGAGRREFLFIFQEINPPYACQLVRIDAGGMEIARRMVDHAIAEWSKCLYADRWPAYPAETAIAFMPTWAVGQWMEEEISQIDKKIDPEVLNAG